MRISDWSSDVCSSDLRGRFFRAKLSCATPQKSRNARFSAERCRTPFSADHSARSQTPHETAENTMALRATPAAASSEERSTGNEVDRTCRSLWYLDH